MTCCCRLHTADDPKVLKIMNIKCSSNYVDFQYKGPGHRRAFFEGWYFKLTLDDTATLSLIPSLHKRGHVIYASLQWIIAKGSDTVSGSHAYGPDQIKLMQNPFQLTLGNNRIDESGILFREKDLNIAVKFKDLHHYRRDIMGPFRRLHGLMPCSHGLLVTNGQADVKIASPWVSGFFDSGVYVEKDWGDTFPDRYIWLQADFPDQEAHLFFSIAKVKIGKINFVGFIANLTLNGKDYTLATWNHSRCKVYGSPTALEITLTQGGITLTIQLKPIKSVNLNSPVIGLMTSSVRESLACPLTLKVVAPKSEEFLAHTLRASAEYHDWF